MHLFWLLLVGALASDDFYRIKIERHVDKRSLGNRRPTFGGNSFNHVNETLLNHDSIYYTGVIHVGTPAKQYVVDFDTGSDKLWIASANCTMKLTIKDTYDCVAQKNRYDLHKSTTGKDLNKTFTIRYGSGAVSGNIVSDIIGLTSNQSAQDKPFTFGVADVLSLQFNDTQFDGIFGLSFSSPDGRDPGPTYIEYLRENNVFENPIFSIWLEKNSSNKVVGGEIVFGGADPDHCGAGLDMPRTLQVDGVSLDGKHIQNKILAVTDTGTTAIYTSNMDVWNAINKKYPLPDPHDPNPKIHDCNDERYKNMTLTFVIGGKEIVLTSKDLFIPMKGGCIVGIFGSSDEILGVDTWLLGDPFIQKYCHIHNYKDETLTLAPAKKSN